MFSYKKYAILRDEKKVTDYEVAKRTGVETSTLSNWKIGRYTPKVNKVARIAKYFGVSIENLMEDEE